VGRLQLLLVAQGFDEIKVGGARAGIRALRTPTIIRTVVEIVSVKREIFK
jgi:hypothetical protein